MDDASGAHGALATEHAERVHDQLGVLNGANRVRDIIIASVDGLTGSAESLNST